jgi:hypothetical protein
MIVYIQYTTVLESAGRGDFKKPKPAAKLGKRALAAVREHTVVALKDKPCMDLARMARIEDPRFHHLLKERNRG